MRHFPVRYSRRRSAYGRAMSRVMEIVALEIGAGLEFSPEAVVQECRCGASRIAHHTVITEGL